MKHRDVVATAGRGPRGMFAASGLCGALLFMGCTGSLDISAFGQTDAGAATSDAASGDGGSSGDGGNDSGDGGSSTTGSDAGDTTGGSNDAGSNTGSSNDAGSNTGSSNDAGGNTGSSDDAGMPPAGNVPAFVAIGHMGRSTLSCDDGQSWVANISADNGFQCWLNGANYNTNDCNDNSWAGRGLAYSNGVFAASFGWGPTTQGGIYSTTDGVSWTNRTSNTTFADLSAGAGTFFANDRAAPRTSSDGSNWPTGGTMSLAQGVFNVRKSAVFSYGGSTRIVVAAHTVGVGEDIVYSTDMGASWTRAANVPAGCASDSEGMAAGNGVVILLSTGGGLCRSTDGGANWSQQSLGGTFNSNPVWTGSEFMAWTSSTVHRSNDGASWSSASLSPGFVNLGPIAVSPGGTFVSSNDNQPWYDGQQFFRSTDGVNWQALGGGSFTGSHPITQIVYGSVAPSAEGCSAN